MKPHEMTLSGLLLRMAELQDELAGLRERLGDFAAQLGGCVALMEELHDAAAAPSATAHGLAVPSPTEPCLPFDELDELFKETKTETKEENSPSIPPSKEERKDKKKENNNNNNKRARSVLFRLSKLCFVCSCYKTKGVERPIFYIFNDSFLFSYGIIAIFAA